MAKSSAIKFSSERVMNQALEDLEVDTFLTIVGDHENLFNLNRPISTLYVQRPDAIPPLDITKCAAQILFSGPYGAQNNEIGHYTSFYYDTECIHFYDSLNRGIVTQQEYLFLNSLFPEHKPQIKIYRVHKQNGFDCGVFAAANLVSKLFGTDPYRVQYAVKYMRPHLLQILQTNVLSPFVVNRTLSCSAESKLIKVINSWQMYEEKNRVSKRKRETSFENSKSKFQKIESNVKVDLTKTKIKLDKPFAGRGSSFEAATVDEPINISYDADRILSQSLEDLEIEAFLKVLGDLENVFNLNRPISPLYVQKPKEIVPLDVNKCAAQILFSGYYRIKNKEIDHYTSFYFDTKTIHFYDSLNRGVLSSGENIVLNALFPKFTPEIQFHHVEYQQNFDSGVYAAANLVTKLLGSQPSCVQFDIKNMRSILRNILLHKEIFSFCLNVGSMSNSKLEIGKNKNDCQKRESKSVKTKKTLQNEFICSFRNIQDDNTVESSYLGPMDEICVSCGSLNFKSELPQDKKFTFCCRKGKFKPLNSLDYPKYFQTLLGTSKFISTIRNYNSMFAFASFGANYREFGSIGPRCIVIHGQIYYDVLSLEPNRDKERSHAQLYVVDTAEANENRLGYTCNHKCDPQIVNQISSVLNDVNPFVSIFKNAYEFLKDNETDKGEMLMWLVKDPNKDKRRYNLPNVSEIAFVYTVKDGMPPAERDICVCLRKSKNARKINYLNENIDSLLYPIFLTRGELGWTPNLSLSSTNTSLTAKNTSANITILQYYQNKLALRKDIFNPILNGGQLTQQFVIDVYLRVLSCRLAFFKTEQQAQKRSALYSGLSDWVRGLTDEGN